MRVPQLALPPPPPVRVLGAPLAAAGAVVTLVAIAGPVTIAGLHIGGATVPALRMLLIAAAISLGLSLLFMPTRATRLELLGLGLSGLGGASLLAMASTLPLMAILLILLAAFHITRPSPRSAAERLRNPGVGAALLGLGGLLLANPALPGLSSVGVVGVALGLAAAAGLMPYLYRFERSEPPAASGLVWTGFIGPVVALAALVKIVAAGGRPLAVFTELCLILGLLNLAWGLLAAWTEASAGRAWGHSFLADWGLALTGFGLAASSPAGLSAAYLTLLAILLVRLPLGLYARTCALESEPPARGGLNLLVGMALAGAAPFAGFTARLLLVQAAATVAWPLVGALLLAMLAWLGPSLRLGGNLGSLQGRSLLGAALVLVLAAALGIAPGLPLTLGAL